MDLNFLSRGLCLSPHKGDLTLCLSLCDHLWLIWLILGVTWYRNPISSILPDTPVLWLLTGLQTLLILLPPPWLPLPILLHWFILKSLLLSIAVPKTQHVDFFGGILSTPVAFNAIFQPMVLKFYISTEVYLSAHLTVSLVSLRISNFYDQNIS